MKLDRISLSIALSTALLLLTACPALAQAPGGGTTGSDRPCGEDRVLLSGQVVCEDGAPVAGCDVLVETTHGDDYIVGTDENGRWSVCVDCAPDAGAVQEITVTARCCGASESFTLNTCPAEQEAPPVVCDCGDGACLPDQTALTGLVTCEDGTPEAGCDVLVQTVLGAGIPAVTDEQGRYTACLPCDGAGGVPQQALVTALCCGESQLVEYLDCPAQIEAPPILCPCTSFLCAEGEVLVSGQVLGRERGPFGSVPSPLGDCEVDLVSRSCGQVHTERVVTDEEGFYEGCVPCADCGLFTEITAEPLCCKSSRGGDDVLTGCPAEHLMPPTFCGRSGGGGGTPLLQPGGIR